MTAPQLYDSNYFAEMRGGSRHQCGAASALHEKFLALAAGPPLEELRVLDAGCGRGELMSLLKNAGAGDVWGFDFSPDAVSIARGQLSERFGPQMVDHVVQGSIEQDDLFPPNHFDLIYLTDVVEHLPQPALEHGLKNISSWLKPNGRVLIHTFPTLSLHRMYLLFLRITGNRIAREKLTAIHCNVQTRRRLERTLARCDLACRRLWLENDFIITSSEFLNMEPGLIKSLGKLVLNDLMNFKPVNVLFRMVGLGELANPSIYCECGKINR